MRFVDHLRSVGGRRGAIPVVVIIAEVAMRVHMKHWMYLADGGDTLVNRVIISKFGIIVSEATEYFRRGAGETASVGPMR